MERAALGYTIVEVMIVLAVTAVLFLSAIGVFASQHTSTNFSQAMQDVNSKIQDYANIVNTSTYPGSGSFSCGFNAATSRPILSNGSPGAGSTCLFLGLAVEAFPAQTSLLAYTVLGNKDLYSGGTDTGSPALSIDTTNPEPAMLPGNNYQLTDNYAINGAATVVYSKAIPVGSAVASTYNIVGMYNGLPGDTANYSSGTNALVLRGYSAVNVGQLNVCIEENVACASTPISKWLICFQDGGSPNKALVTATAAPGGISTKLTFLGCP